MPTYRVDKVKNRQPQVLARMWATGKSPRSSCGHVVSLEDRPAELGLLGSSAPTPLPAQEEAWPTGHAN